MAGQPSSDVTFRDACQAVLHAFETIHVGMDGLQFKSATFPPNEGFTIVQSTKGSIVAPLNSLEQWAPHAPTEQHPITVEMAYWACRVNNNCLSVNLALLNVLKECSRKQSKIECMIDGTLSFISLREGTLSHRTLGLTPHHVGTVVEPPFVSKVPPSPDGETYHTFVVGLEETTGVPIALDCSVAQFGVFGTGSNDGVLLEPFLALPVPVFLRRVGKMHRILGVEEFNDSNLRHPLVHDKVGKCTKLALRRLRLKS